MRIQNLIPLREALPTKRLFRYMTSLTFVPSVTIGDYMDEEYFWNYSGGKQISPLVESLYGRTDYSEEDIARYMAAIVVNRYGPKWEALFRQYASLATLDILNNISVTKTTEYGKNVGKNIADNLTSAEHKAIGTDKTTASVASNTDTVNPDNPRKSTKEVSGSYSDSGSSVNTRTGSQVVTDKGSILSSTYGFNSADAVPSSLSGPVTDAGTTTETTFGEEGLKDAETSGSTRSYKDYKEATVESGEQLSNSIASGDEHTDTTESGTKVDDRQITSSEQASGRDVITETGRDLKSLVDEYLTLFMSADILDFLAIVYDDCDNVMTCPFYA